MSTGNGGKYRGAEGKTPVTRAVQGVSRMPLRVSDNLRRVEPLLFLFFVVFTLNRYFYQMTSGAPNVRPDSS